MNTRDESELPRHSEQASRTRPTRRRPDLPRLPNNRRRQAALNRWTLIIGVLVGLSAIIGGLIARSGRDSTSPDLPTAPAGAVAVSVLDIIDGDTLTVEDASGEVLTVRLFGIDAPERGQPCYQEATDRLRDLAAAQVLLVPDQRLQDSGGRELRYVYTATGVSIDAALLDEGLAEAWTQDGALREQLMAIEAEARTAGRGCLWGG